MCSNWSLLPWEAEDELMKSGNLCDWLGTHIWLSMVDHQLGAGTKIREAAS